MTTQDQLMQRYLLGEMSEAEQARLEEQYFNDQRMFDQIVLVESELVDMYARGQLPQAARELFERNYLAHPRRRERANFAAALTARLDPVNDFATVPVARTESVWSGWLEGLRGPKLAWAFSLSLLLMAALAGWFLIESRRLRQEVANTESQRALQEQRERELQQQVADERQRSEQLSADLARLRAEQEAQASPSANEAPTFVSLVLSITGTRSTDGASPALLVIPPRIGQVRLQLNLRESDYLRYSIVIQAAGGKEIFTATRLAPRVNKSGARLTLTVPAQKFAAADYILTLRGVSETGDAEDVSKSLFHVERK